MEAKEFLMLVNNHSLCPNDLLYNSNALCGEAGECANMVKKIQMANICPDWVQQKENPLKDKEVFTENLKDELSDVLFYLTRLALDIGLTLEDLMDIQSNKLNDRTHKYQRTFLK